MRHLPLARLLTPRTALIGLCTVILIAYLPGLRGPFVFDDIPNIVENEAIALEKLSLTGLVDAAWSGASGGIKRPIAYASFALDYLIAGGFSNTLPFKLTNVLIHLLNTVLVYVLAKRLLQRLAAKGNGIGHGRHQWISIAAAAMWALHPLHTTTVLFVVQRMTSLAAMFVLLGTAVFLTGRDMLPTRPRRGWVLMWTGLGMGLLLGLSAKENAAVTPFLMLAVEYTLYDRQQLDPHARRRLCRFYLAICGIPLFLAVTWLLTHPEFVSWTYTYRDFGPTERLLTEARVLWFYLALVAIPDITKLSLFHDDFSLSTGLMEPWVTLPAIAGLVLLLATAIWFRRRAPLLSLAILWFFIAHSIESTILGLELVFEHRNYLPDVILFIAVVHGLAKVMRNDTYAVLACLALVLTYTGITFLRAQTWGQEDLLIESMARNHPRSARSQAMMGELLAYRRGALEDALPHYRAAIRLTPTDPAYAIQMVLATARLTPPGKSVGTRPAPSPRVTSALPDISNLSRHIYRQLSARRPSFSTLRVLDSAVDCVIESPRDCQDLHGHVLDWCLALLDDPDIKPDTRLFAIDRVLRLTVENKEYKRALEIVARARRAEPDNNYYAFLEADVYFRVSKFGEAERIAATIQENSDDHELQGKIARLLSMITAARTGDR